MVAGPFFRHGINKDVAPAVKGLNWALAQNNLGDSLLGKNNRVELIPAGITQGEYIPLAPNPRREKVQKPHCQKPQAGDHCHTYDRIGKVRPAWKQHRYYGAGCRDQQRWNQRVQNKAENGPAVGLDLAWGSGEFRQQKVQMPLQTIPRIGRDHGGNIIFFLSVSNRVDENRIQPQQFGDQALADVDIIDLIQADGVASVGDNTAVDQQLLLVAAHHEVFVPDQVADERVKPAEDDQISHRHRRGRDSPGDRTRQALKRAGNSVGKLLPEQRTGLGDKGGKKQNPGERAAENGRKAGDIKPFGVVLPRGEIRISQGVFPFGENGRRRFFRQDQRNIHIVTGSGPGIYPQLDAADRFQIKRTGQRHGDDFRSGNEHPPAEQNPFADGKTGRFPVIAQAPPLQKGQQKNDGDNQNIFPGAVKPYGHSSAGQSGEKAAGNRENQQKQKSPNHLQQRDGMGAVFQHNSSLSAFFSACAVFLQVLGIGKEKAGKIQRCAHAVNHDGSKAKWQHVRRAQGRNVLDIVQRDDSAAVVEYAAVENQIPVMQKECEFNAFERVVNAKEKKKENADQNKGQAVPKRKIGQKERQQKSRQKGYDAGANLPKKQGPARQGVLFHILTPFSRRVSSSSEQSAFWLDLPPAPKR